MACWPWRSARSTSLQMIASDDIGAFAALAFARPQEFIGKALEIAGDSLTMPQVADAFTRVTGQPVRFVKRHWSRCAASMRRWLT